MPLLCLTLLGVTGWAVSGWSWAAPAPKPPPWLGPSPETADLSGGLRPSPGVALVHVGLVDLDDGSVRADQTILIDDGRILAVGPADHVRVPRGWTRHEGGFVMPGLVDAHVHLDDERDLVAYLAAGVTRVVNLSGSPLQLSWRDQVEEGSLPGPSITTSGPMVDEVSEPVFGQQVGVESPAGAAAEVADQAALRYDVLKLHGDLEVGLYDAVMDAAKARNLPVVGHISERVGLLHTMSRRPMTVEHTEELVFGFFNERLEPRRVPVAIDALRDGGAAVTPTLVSALRLPQMIGENLVDLEARPENVSVSPLRRWDWGAAHNRWRTVLTGQESRYTASYRFQRELVTAMFTAGVPLLAGTDAGWLPHVLPGTDLITELMLLEEAGVPRVDVLRAATRTPGQLYTRDPLAGRITPGAPADLLMLHANPLRARDAIREVAAVMVQGRLYEKSPIDQLLALSAQTYADEVSAAAALQAGDLSAAAAASAPLTEPGLRQLVRALLRLGGPAPASAAIETWHAHHAPTWHTLLLLGRLQHQLGDDDAVTTLQRALVAAPTVARSTVEAQLRESRG